MTKDQYYINRCFELARRGRGGASPNPIVGAVIVHGDRIIGEGYHQKYGEAHAEVNAVKDAKVNGYEHLLAKSTIYVSLEPCCFHGNTPACTDLIKQHQIPRVVISALDVTPKVNGKGIELLRTAGVEVMTGVLKKEGEAVVEERAIFVRKKRPYVILKYAQSSDGYFGKENEQVWISNRFSKRLVHKWRGEVDAILIGTNTAAVDNPALTNRLFYGKSPKRIVLDQHDRLSKNLQIFDGKIPTFVVSKEKLQHPNIQHIQHPFDTHLLPDLLTHLHQQKIGSLLVEGGRRLLDNFMQQNLWDEARVLIGSKELKNGIPAPTLTTKLAEQYELYGDLVKIYRNESPK
ncbi:MAG: bifunctional diaminohydroxyphosphoribosylaminopyrimidine deaminase/5-amino-6-(5-phosphoribosylamino)uracil reductase RibD [Bacteroidota bacterium]